VRLNKRVYLESFPNAASTSMKTIGDEHGGDKIVFLAVYNSSMIVQAKILTKAPCAILDKSFLFLLSSMESYR
jgi:hypothetical protein